MDESTIMIIDVLKQKVEALEKHCRHCERQFEMLIHQLSRDGRLIQAHETKISKLEALHRDDYK